jgi:hypothetical protein
MAATLPGLPSELLLQIWNCAGPGWVRQQFYKTMRATCRTINEKIVRYYGQTWYKDVVVPFTKVGLLRL